MTIGCLGIYRGQRHSKNIKEQRHFVYRDDRKDNEDRRKHCDHVKDMFIVDDVPVFEILLVIKPKGQIVLTD